MSDQLSCILTAPIVEPPRQGVSPLNNRRFARVTVGGPMGSEFIKIDISLPDDMPIEQFIVGQVWQWPLMLPQGGKDRKVFFRLRNDSDGKALLKRIDA